MMSNTPTPSPSAGNGSISPSPPPSEMAQLKFYLRGQSGPNILRHCLGLERLRGAPTLADSIMVVAFDTEDYERNHARLNEIGVFTWVSRAMREITGIDDRGQSTRQTGDIKNIEPYGEKLLQNMYFYHARIQENAHLINIKFCPGDPTANHFGQTRFLTVPDTRKMLTDMFNWPIDEQKPELGFCPVVVLGQAVKENDVSALQNTLGFSIFQVPNYMCTLDTQNLTPQTTWWRPDQPGQVIGLRTLVGQVIGFDYEGNDPHTACNDAALTVVCALQMALPSKHKVNRPKSLDLVVKDVGELSKNELFGYGSAIYCIRCGSHDHLRKDCTTRVLCTKCKDDPKRKRGVWSHDTSCCSWNA